MAGAARDMRKAMSGLHDLENGEPDPSSAERWLDVCRHASVRGATTRRCRGPASGWDFVQ